MADNLNEIETLYNELKSHSFSDDSTRTHEIYAELAQITEIPLLEDSIESEWKSLSQNEWNAVQMRSTMTIERISEELSKTSPVEINPFEVEVILKEAQERIEYHVQSLLSENQNSGVEIVADSGTE